jgi:hypothetical protein
MTTRNDCSSRRARWAASASSTSPRKEGRESVTTYETGNQANEQNEAASLDSHHPRSEKRPESPGYHMVPLNDSIGLVAV